MGGALICEERRSSYLGKFGGEVFTRRELISPTGSSESSKELNRQTKSKTNAAIIYERMVLT